MRSKRSPSVLGVLALVLTSVVGAGGCGRAARAPEALSDASRVRSATLERDLLETGEKRRLVLADRASIDSLLALALFETKNPCACEHLERVSFAIDGGVVDASLCRHCFDVREGGSATSYSMTPEFYAEFRRLVDAAPIVKAR